MTRPDLPDPKTPHDRYLHDIATTQRAILDHLTGGGDTADGGTVTLIEPAGGHVNLDGMKRKELDAYAASVGVENPSKLPNIDAVKAAIAEAR